MPWPVTINGKTWKDTDFQPYGYVQNFPTLMQDVSDVATTMASNFSTASSLASTVASGPVLNVQRRGRALTGVVSVDPMDATNVIATKGQMFLPGTTLDGTFARASAATYTDGSGIIRTAASGAPRYYSDPVTGEYRGLLFESASTNSFLNSQDFNNATWTKTNVTITSGATTAPDNTLTADRFVYASGALGYVSRAVSVTASTAYALSMFAKAGEHTSFIIIFGNGFYGSAGVNRTATFNLTAGTVAVTSATGNEMTASIKAYPNGWYRCTVIVVPTTTTSAFSPQIGRSTVNGDGVGGMFFWGAQFETSGHASEYNATTSAAVTVPADTLIIPFGDWYNPKEGTFFYEFQSNGNSNQLQYIGGTSLTGVANNNDAIYHQFTTSGTIATSSRIASAAAVVMTSAVVTKSNLHRLAVAYGPSDMAQSVDGAAVQSTTATTVSTIPDRWVLGSASWVPGSTGLQGGIVQARYIPRRLSNATLQRMTA